MLLIILFGFALAGLAFPNQAACGAATAWIKLHNAGVSHYGGAGEPVALALDGRGNVYVAGYSLDSGWIDYTTLKYSPQGRRLWLRHYNYKSLDAPSAMALDDRGNVSITGKSVSFGPYHDWYNSVTSTIKYNPDGKRLWARHYDRPSDNPYYDDSWDEARAIAVDSQGNIYVTGASWGGNTAHYDFLTIKYGPEGRRLWVRRYNSPLNVSEGARALAVDGQGNVYVTGGWGGGGAAGYLTIKYNTDGRLLWVRRYNGLGYDSDSAQAIALDSQGNVYVTGYSHGIGSRSDYATIKYSPDGEELWVRRYNGPGNSVDEAVAIALDVQGNVYVAGSSVGIGTDVDYATIKYSPDGEELWAARYNGPANGWDRATAMALDAQGNVYVTGTSDGGGAIETMDWEYATVSYSPDGRQRWVMRYNRSENSWNEAKAIAVDGQGNVYVTGTSVRYGYVDPIDSFYVTIKYIQTPRTGR